MIIRHLPGERVFQMSAAGLAVFLNCILCILIKNKSPPNLGVYKYLMMYMALFELFYAIFDFFCLPYIHCTMAGFLVFLDPLFDFPIAVVQVLDYIHCGSFGVLMVIFALHFVYRYCVVSGKKKFTSPDPWKIVAWISTPLLVGLIWTSGLVAFFGKNKISDGFVAVELQANIAYVGPVFNFSMDFQANEHTYAGLAMMFLIGFLSLLVTVFFAFKCYFAVRAITKDSTKSYTYKSLQAQLFYVLVAQTLIPFLFIFFPVGLLAVTISNNLGHYYYGHVLTFTSALYPVLDPLPNMLMIKPYREALKCSKPRLRIKNHVSVPSNNASFIRKKPMCNVYQENKFFS